MWIGLWVLALWLAAVPAGAEEPASKPFQLVCSTTQVADFTRQAAGDRCVVRCILAPGADPHTYQPTPGDAQMVLAADLCLQNGLHLEGNNWMAKLAADSGKKVVSATDGLAPLEMKYEGQAVADPHAWFSTRNAAGYVNRILAALIALDPAGTVEYQSRARLYLGQLRTLDAWIRREIHPIAPEKRILVTSHDAFNYFCREYRFNPQNDFLSLAPVGWSTGAETGGGMTPERRRQVTQSLTQSGAQAVFVESSVNPKLIQEIAREAGIRVGGRLFSDSMGEAGSAGETYVGMMRENVITITRGLTP
jgi:manganese/iron transport system substrate-binding protein